MGGGEILKEGYLVKSPPDKSRKVTASTHSIVMINHSLQNVWYKRCCDAQGFAVVGSAFLLRLRVDVMQMMEVH